MTLTEGIARHNFYHEGCFLLPVEHLSRSGLDAELAREVGRRSLLSPDAVRLFDAALACFFERCDALHAAAPDVHPPPRLSNVLVVTAQETTRPFFQPFVDMSVIVYATDLDHERSSAEHVAFQILFGERLGQLKRYGKALLATLPFLLSLRDDEAEAFTRGAARSERPDNELSRRLAALLPRLRAHVLAEGAGLGAEAPEGYGRIQGTPLAIDRAFFPELGALGKAVEEAASNVAGGYLERQRRRSTSHEDEVCAYLREARPEVLLVAEPGTILWDPERAADVDAVRAALSEIGELPSKSLVLDLATVARVTRDFFTRVAPAGALAVPTESLEESGGVFVHHERKLVAYALVQPGLDVCAEAAPPFHRQLLAARVAHEWGHLAVDAGFVPKAPDKQAQDEEAALGLRTLFARIARTAPPAAREAIAGELAEHERARIALEDLPLARIEDYRSNLVSRRILAREELEAYIRVNIRSLAAEPIGVLQKLARYAYEAQYLWLSEMPDPWRYLLSSTYLREEMVESEIVSEAALRELVDLVGRRCTAYAIDESKLAGAAG